MTSMKQKRIDAVENWRYKSAVVGKHQFDPCLPSNEARCIKFMGKASSLIVVAVEH